MCPSCRWTSKPKIDEVEPEEEIPPVSLETLFQPKFRIEGLFSDNSQRQAGKIFFLLGILALFGGLSYKTSVCSDRSEFSSRCLSEIHNLGLLNDRSNIVNIGGFLLISGSILVSRHKTQSN